jgi:hypothetical protein
MGVAWPDVRGETEGAVMELADWGGWPWMAVRNEVGVGEGGLRGGVEGVGEDREEDGEPSWLPAMVKGWGGEVASTMARGMQWVAEVREAWMKRMRTENSRSICAEKPRNVAKFWIWEAAG